MNDEQFKSCEKCGLIRFMRLNDKLCYPCRVAVLEQQRDELLEALSIC